MQLSDEQIRAKKVAVYDKDPNRDLVFAVEAYNSQAEKYRTQMRTRAIYERCFWIFNFLIFSLVYALLQSRVSFNEPLGTFFLLLAVVSYLYFALYKKNFWLHTLCSLPLMFIWYGYIVLILLDIWIAYYRGRIDEKLGDLPGYPDFYDVFIEYMPGAAPSAEGAKDLTLRGGTGMLIVDRIEEDTIVLECSNPASGEVYEQNIPRTWVLDEVREGDVLCKTADGYAVDEAETRKRRLAASIKLQSIEKNER